jgi:hypothetical protein
MSKIAYDKRWNNYIANIWNKIFQKINFPKNGAVVEVAPGEANKLGLALKKYGFVGSLYVIEPNEEYLKSITNQYKQTLKKSKIIPILQTLEKSDKFLPKKIDAIISNHPLDDMLLGCFLDKYSSENFLNHNYGLSPSTTKEYWECMKKTKNFLPMAKKKVTLEWCKIINKKNPQFCLIYQYKSYYFQKNKILLPDKNAADVLKLISNKYSKFKINTKDLNVSKGLKEKKGWLILKFK